MQKKKKLTIAAVVVVLIALCAALYGYYVIQQKKKAFNEASELFKNGDYVGAAEGYEPIGSFQKADDMTLLSRTYGQLEEGQFEEAANIAKDLTEFTVGDEELQSNIDTKKGGYYEMAGNFVEAGNFKDASDVYKCLGEYNDSAKAATYYEGRQKIEDDDLEAAIALFEQVEDYQDAAEWKNKCSSYLEAAGLQEQGDDDSLDKAADIFTDLGDFKDSEDRALACKSVKMFREAKELADNKDYKGAYKILNQYPQNPYEGWTDLLDKCDKHIKYKEAKKYYDQEHYYKAYKIFDGLGDFKDSKEKAKKCVRDYPAKNILYQNSDFSSSAVSFTIDNTGFMNTYIKLYSSKDTLVARIFIKEGKSATIHLTSGTYHINQAYGQKWYGQKDMFGDDGRYLKCKVAGDYNFTLKNHYAYTMKKGAGGDAVSNESIGAGDF